VPPAAVLFMCVFASQAAVLVLSPILVEVARDFDVSTAVAGQLRTLAAPLAVVVAVLVARSAARVPLRSLLLAGTALIFAGSIASAAAPSFSFLALAQVPLGPALPCLLPEASARPALGARRRSEAVSWRERWLVPLPRGSSECPRSDWYRVSAGGWRSWLSHCRPPSPQR
jgi:MFS family permease